MQKSVFLFLVINSFFLSCSTCTSLNTPEEISVTNWNIQTFFDANNDGIEYSEFRNKNSRWDVYRYEDRLKKLCDIIEKVDSDVFVMEEVENEKILFDISNRLSHNVWFPGKIYRFAVFSKEEGSSIGCGVISRYEIKEINVHSLDVKTEKEKVPSMRPIMEVTINAGSEDVKMFVNHWKSKSGGDTLSEKWRKWQECILSERMNAYKEDLVEFAVGDFNKDINSFLRNDDERLFFTILEEENNDVIEVYSPWDDYENEKYGTYYFRGNWEKIDHFFALEQNTIMDFSINSFPEIINQDGSPMRYEIFNNKGYSDHLPITCRIRLKNSARG